MDRPVHGGRLPAHRAGHGAARAAARARAAPVRQAPGRAAGRRRAHGRHDALLRVGVCRCARLTCTGSRWWINN